MAWTARWQTESWRITCEAWCSAWSLFWWVSLTSVSGSAVWWSCRKKRVLPVWKMSLLFTQWKLNEAVMTFEGILDKSVLLSSFLYTNQMAQHRYRGEDWSPARGNKNQRQSKCWKVTRLGEGEKVKLIKCSALRWGVLISYFSLIRLTATWRRSLMTVRPQFSLPCLPHRFWAHPTSALKIYRGKFFMSRLWSEKAGKKDNAWRLRACPLFFVLFSPPTPSTFMFVISERRNEFSLK